MTAAGRAVRPLLLAWLGLLVLLGLEVGVARLLGWGDVAPLIGLAMALVTAVTFMHAGEGPAIIRVFAFASMFWLAVILSLGSMDALTRVDHPVVMRTPVSP